MFSDQNIISFIHSVTFTFTFTFIVMSFSAFLLFVIKYVLADKV